MQTETLLQRIEAVIEARKPTVYFVVDFDKNEASVGVIDSVSCDYEIEPETVSIDEAMHLSEQFSEAESMYYKVVDDERESLSKVDYQEALDKLRHLNKVAPPLTCSFADAVQLLLDAVQRDGTVCISIEGARWAVQS